MGFCHEFAVQVAADCDVGMLAAADHCACPGCGFSCPGRFAGCPQVWAAGPVRVVLRAPSGLASRTAAHNGSRNGAGHLTGNGKVRSASPLRTAHPAGSSAPPLAARSDD